MSTPRYTVPGVTPADAQQVLERLQQRLHALNDLALTLKHVHWNVVGPHFIAVHTMIDPQVEAVRAMVDETAERMATLGGSPDGTPGALVAERTWENYKLGRADAQEHLVALDHVYSGIIVDHRRAAEATGSTDPVTQDLLIGQLHSLEQFQWFVRAHHETAGGTLTDAPAKKAAAPKGRKK
ncbi:Dps family protein [Streptacidiphilus cavernicola]|uniref:Dps family protein n=1 Tax=Streptacidiphilus cavernicola TaxID=3342716 RepID=A0ABV6VQ34_9ACTN